LLKIFMHILQEHVKNVERISKMEKFKCNVCGYEYDPAKGDPENGIPAGTPFEKLPENWVCPVCQVGKDNFERM